MLGRFSRLGQAVVAAAGFVFCVSAASAQVHIETVPVGHPGNPADTHGAGYGAVDYAYSIGAYEVTAGQYTTFLNAVAATDTYGLYNPDMYSRDTGCKIRRHGSPGSYTYSVAGQWANRPVNYVSWGDAARFANWLHNGQRSGDQDLATTEDGAYFLNGATSDTALLGVERKADWKWAIPTEDEWYKAAYHKNDGATGHYFDWPTGSDARPSNLFIDADPGNNATFCTTVFIRDGRHRGDYTIGSPHYRTEVGAHENSRSPYGTFDQGGNVWEWNEAVMEDKFRGVRGGSFNWFDLYVGGHTLGLYAGSRNDFVPSYESDSFGFRVSAVPEPGCIVLLATGAVGLLRRGRRRGRRRRRGAGR